MEPAELDPHGHSAPEQRQREPMDRADTFARKPVANAHSTELLNALGMLVPVGPSGSDEIEVTNLTKAINCIGLRYTDETLSKELSVETDADGDGKLELHEFDAYFKQMDRLTKAGIEGSVEPWYLGRSLAIDALPLAARTYTAHACIVDAIADSAARVAPTTPRRRSTGSTRGASSHLSSVAAADAMPSDTFASHQASSHQPLSSFPRPRSASTPRAHTPLLKSEVKKSVGEEALLKSFVVWEETKTDFAAYKVLRRRYEDAWKGAAKLRTRRRTGWRPVLHSSDSGAALTSVDSSGSNGAQTPARSSSSSSLLGGRLAAHLRPDWEGELPSVSRAGMLLAASNPRRSNAPTVGGMHAMEAGSSCSSRQGTRFHSTGTGTIRNVASAGASRAPIASPTSASTPMQVWTSQGRLRPPSRPTRVFEPCYTSCHAAAAAERTRVEALEMSVLLVEGSTEKQGGHPVLRTRCQ